jgi:hypothetical protein
MRERMLVGDLYIADDEEIAEESRRALDLMDAYNATTAATSRSAPGASRTSVSPRSTSRPSPSVTTCSSVRTSSC